MSKLMQATQWLIASHWRTASRSLSHNVRLGSTSAAFLDSEQRLRGVNSRASMLPVQVSVQAVAYPADTVLRGQ